MCVPSGLSHPETSERSGISCGFDTRTDLKKNDVRWDNSKWPSDLELEGRRLLLALAYLHEIDEEIIVPNFASLRAAVFNYLRKTSEEANIRPAGTRLQHM